MSYMSIALQWMLVHFVALVYILECYPWRLYGLYRLKRPSNVLLPILWICSSIFSFSGISLALASPRSEVLDAIITVFSLINVFALAISCKMMFYYRRSLIALFLSSGACLQGLGLIIALGINDTMAAITYLPSLIINISTHLIYGIFLHRRGSLNKTQSKDIDLTQYDSEILSNYIKVT